MPTDEFVYRIDEFAYEHGESATGELKRIKNLPPGTDETMISNLTIAAIQKQWPKLIARCTSFRVVNKHNRRLEKLSSDADVTIQVLQIKNDLVRDGRWKDHVVNVRRMHSTAKRPPDLNATGYEYWYRCSYTPIDCKVQERRPTNWAELTPSHKLHGHPLLLLEYYIDGFTTLYNGRSVDGYYISFSNVDRRVKNLSAFTFVVAYVDKGLDPGPIKEQIRKQLKALEDGIRVRFAEVKRPACAGPGDARHQAPCHHNHHAQTTTTSISLRTIISLAVADLPQLCANCRIPQSSCSSCTVASADIADTHIPITDATWARTSKFTDQVIRQMTAEMKTSKSKTNVDDIRKRYKVFKPTGWDAVFADPTKKATWLGVDLSDLFKDPFSGLTFCPNSQSFRDRDHLLLFGLFKGVLNAIISNVLGGARDGATKHQKLQIWKNRVNTFCWARGISVQQWKPTQSVGSSVTMTLMRHVVFASCTALEGLVDPAIVGHVKNCWQLYRDSNSSSGVTEGGVIQFQQRLQALIVEGKDLLPVWWDGRTPQGRPNVHGLVEMAFKQLPRMLNLNMAATAVFETRHTSGKHVNMKIANKTTYALKSVCHNLGVRHALEGGLDKKTGMACFGSEFLHLMRSPSKSYLLDLLLPMTKVSARTHVHSLSPGVWTAGALEKLMKRAKTDTWKSLDDLADHATWLQVNTMDWCAKDSVFKLVDRSNVAFRYPSFIYMDNIKTVRRLTIRPQDAVSATFRFDDGSTRPSYGLVEGFVEVGIKEGKLADQSTLRSYKARGGAVLLAKIMWYRNDSHPSGCVFERDAAMKTLHAYTIPGDPDHFDLIPVGDIKGQVMVRHACRFKPIDDGKDAKDAPRFEPLHCCFDGDTHEMKHSIEQVDQVHADGTVTRYGRRHVRIYDHESGFRPKLEIVLPPLGI